MIPSTEEMTAMSEKIRDHLNTQRARATILDDYGYPRCLYRADGGLMCAVGCLIPNERYNPELEGPCASTPCITRAVLGYDLPEDVSGDAFRYLLNEWQRYHDSDEYQDWIDGYPGAKSPDEKFLALGFLTTT